MEFLDSMTVHMMMQFTLHWRMKTTGWHTSGITLPSTGASGELLYSAVLRKAVSTFLWKIGDTQGRRHTAPYFTSLWAKILPMYRILAHYHVYS